MLSHKELVNDPNWYFTCGTYGYDRYNVGDVCNEHTNERGVGIKVDFYVVGKDEIDALYRIQRIIEDKIHEARNRPAETEEVPTCDEDALPGLLNDVDPFA